MPFLAYTTLTTSFGPQLMVFDISNPTSAFGHLITNVTAGETLVGIDFRPANGLLYGLGVDASADTGTVYVISTGTDVATPVGTFGGIGDLPPGHYGFDFDPTFDRIRVTTDTGLNFRLNPNDGSVAGVDPAIVGSAISGAAYTNNQPDGGDVTTLYTLDAAADRLMIQNPANSGTEIPVGSLGLDFTDANGFDIPAGIDATVSGSGVSSGTGFAMLTVSGHSNVFSINLATGGASLIGPFLGGAPVSGLAIQNVGHPFDFDADRHGDFLFQNINGTAKVWLVDGNSVSTVGPALPNPGPTAHIKDSADFDGDGRSDILWQNDNGAPSLWLMNGTGVATMGPALTNPGPTAHAIAAADFDFDGRADILWQNDNGAPSIWLMDGAGVRRIGDTLANPGPSAHAKDAADFDGDGRADILWQNDDGTPSIWLMLGTTVQTIGPALTNPGPAAHVVKAADFDGDGKADILWQNANGTPSIWLMDGVNVATSGPALFNPGPAWHVVDARDTNGDGKADIIWQNDDGTPAIWLMDGINAATIGPALGNPGSDWHLL